MRHQGALSVLRVAARQVPLAVVATLAIVFTAALTADAAMPYRRMAQSAASLLSVGAQARDQVLQLELRRVLLAQSGVAGLEITPAVYMERGFVAGLVDKEEQAAALLAAARDIQGLRSVDWYLPARAPSGGQGQAEGAGSGAGIQVGIKRAILAAGLPVARYHLKVVEGNVVVMGVVESPQERAGVEQAVRSASGVTGVTNFLLVVEPAYAARRPRLR